MATYHKADTGWMAGSVGLSVHWTSRSCPLTGERLPYGEAVGAFDLPRFVDQLQEAGAQHLIFTTTHADQFWAGPHPVLDCLLPGRTSERDLLGELVEALAAAGIRLIFYYNHSCNLSEDFAWENAVGYNGGPYDLFAARLMSIVEYVGFRYGRQLAGWWFDSCYSLDPRGPNCTVGVELDGWQFPWESFAAAAKSGNPERVIAFNAGIDEHFRYTRHQDYHAGETLSLQNRSFGAFTPDGLRFHQWTCIDNREWVHARPDTPFAAPCYGDEELGEFILAHRSAGAAVTFNCEIDQTGLINPDCVSQLGAVLRQIG